MNRNLTDKEKLIRDIAKKNNPYDPNCHNNHLWEEGFVAGFEYSEGANDFADKVLKAQPGDGEIEKWLNCEFPLHKQPKNKRERESNTMQCLIQDGIRYSLKAMRDGLIPAKDK